MSILDGLLGQVAGQIDIKNLAEKIGLSPEQAEQAVVALGQAHPQPGDTVQTAAERTGLPENKLAEIVEHLGGEGSLGQFASLLQGHDGVGGALSGFASSLFGKG